MRASPGTHSQALSQEPDMMFTLLSTVRDPRTGYSAFLLAPRLPEQPRFNFHSRGAPPLWATGPARPPRRLLSPSCLLGTVGHRGSAGVSAS